MFGNLRSLIDFSGDQLHGAERRTGERLLEESDYQGAELHLAQAILESERRQEPAAQHREVVPTWAQARRYSSCGKTSETPNRPTSQIA